MAEQGYVLDVDGEVVSEPDDVVAGRDAIGVIATPQSAAAEVADLLVAAGVTSILNLAGGTLALPDHVDVRPVELAGELQILAFHKQRRALAVDLAQVAP